MKRIKFERNKIILTIIDILIIALASIISRFLLSNTFYFKSSEWQQIGTSIVLSIVIYQVFFRLFNLYRNITRYENGKDYLSYIFVCAISCLTTYLVKNIFKINAFTTKECILSCIFIVVGTVSYRIIIRMMISEIQPSSNDENMHEAAKNLLIIGAGKSARDIIKAIKEGLKITYCIVGLIDDNQAKWNYSISGVKILGNRYKIKEVCEKYQVQEISLYNKINSGMNTYRLWTATEKDGYGVDLMILEMNNYFCGGGFSYRTTKNEVVLTRPILTAKTILWSNQYVSK